MKTIQYHNMDIQNYERFYETVRKKYQGIMGGEWDAETKLLKLFYEDDATEISLETLQKILIPSILKFKKRFVKPDLDIPDTTVLSVTDTEIVVETLHPAEARQKIALLKPEFEEIE